MNKNIFLNSLLVGLALAGPVNLVMSTPAAAEYPAAGLTADMIVTAPRLGPGDMVVTAPRLVNPDPELMVSIEADVQRATALATGRSSRVARREIRLAADRQPNRG